MSNIVKHAAGIALASTLAVGAASQANAQLITHKDLSLGMATQIAVAAVEALLASLLHELPAPLHAPSVQPRALLDFTRLVPPTPVTYAEVLG